MSHDRNDRRSRNVVRGSADFNGIQHDALFKRHKISFRVEIFGDLLGHFFVERQVDGRENAAVHQFSLEVFCENAQFFGEIFNRQTFRQCDFAEFARRFRFGLRPDIWRFQLLFRLAFVALRTIHAFVYGPALLNHRRRWHRRSPGAIPRTRSCRGARRRRAALESRCGRMSWLSLWRTHRPLTGAIRRSALARRRRWRQPMLLPEPLLHDLLHGLSLFMRRLDSGRYGRTNSCWGRNDSATARRGLYYRRRWRLDFRRSNGRRRSYGRGSHGYRRRKRGLWRNLCRRRRSLLFNLGFWFGFNERRRCDDLDNRFWFRRFRRG